MDEVKTTVLENKPLTLRPPFVCDRAEFILILPALFAGYAFIRLIRHIGYGIAVPLFMALVYLTALLYMRLAKISSHTRKALPWHGLVLLLTLPFLLFDGRDGRLFVTLCALFPAAAFALYTQLGCRRFSLREERFAADLWNAALCAPFGNMGALWCSGERLARQGRSRNFLLVLVGILLGLPFLLVLTILLASADAAFEGLLDLVELQLFDRFPMHLSAFLWGIPFAMILFGILYGCRYKRRTQSVTDFCFDKTRRIPAALAFGMLFPVVFVCLCYLFSQFAYFFSAFSGLLPADFTYAEYARRGFFELCAISVLLLALTAAINLFLQTKTAAVQRTRQLISAFFCLFALILTATSLSKMALYIGVYGVTPLRLSTTLFMTALGVSLIIILLRLFLPKVKAVRLLTVTALTTVLLFSYMDMDVLSLQLNHTLMQNEVIQTDDSRRFIGGFPFEELVTMSDGIVPFLTRQAASDDPQTAALAKQVLTARPDYRPARTDLKTWNLSTFIAARLSQP